MASMLNILAAALVAATAGMFILRRRHEAPRLSPYLLVALAGVVSAWLGELGAGPFAVGMMIAGSFLLLHIASLPYLEKGDNEPRRQGE